MSMDQTSKFCRNCNADVLAERPGTSHLLHAILSVLTCGVWIIIWILCAVKIGGWKCSKCGKSV